MTEPRPTKTAETARQERAQGGQPHATRNGDPNLSAVGPPDKPHLTNKIATEGTGMLPDPGKPSDDDDMAPGG